MEPSLEVTISTISTRQLARDRWIVMLLDIATELAIGMETGN
jgi:hypothetical protein